MLRRLLVVLLIAVAISGSPLAANRSRPTAHLAPRIDPDTENALEQVLYHMGTHVGAVIDTQPAGATCDVALQFRQVQWLTIAAMGVVQSAQSDVHVYSLIDTRADRVRARQYLGEIHGSYRRTLETDLNLLVVMRQNRNIPSELAVLSGQIQEDLRTAISVIDQPVQQ